MSFRDNCVELLDAYAEKKRPENNHKHEIVPWQISLIIHSCREVVLLDVSSRARRSSSSAITPELAVTELGVSYWGSDTEFSSNYSAF